MFNKKFKYGSFLDEGDSGGGTTNFTQEQVNAMIAEAKAKAESDISSLKTSHATELQTLKTELETLKESANTDLRGLIEQKTTKITELNAELTKALDRVTSFETLVKSQLDNEMKDWPKEIVDLIPANSSPIDLLREIDKYRTLAKKLTETSVPPDGQGGSRGGSKETAKTVVESVLKTHNAGFAVPGKKV